MIRSRAGPLAIATAVLASGWTVACERVEILLQSEPDLAPHERYAASLATAGLEETALGREWLAAAERALQDPIGVESPYRETSYLPADRPTSVGYALELERGQSLEVRVEVEADPSPQIFLDIFRRVRGAQGDPPEYRLLASADSGSLSMAFEPARDGEYLLRLQPELLRSARYTLTLTAGGALAFPVEGGSTRDVGSGFGAPREGGRREHQGVDIFASRGTPVLAVVDGRVSRVRDRGLGGKYIWVRDSRRGLSLYHAHLDAQLVREGETVRIGDTLGLVGNSGNARTTPPHLHFGVYARGEGPIDPLPFIVRRNRRPPELTIALQNLESRLRLRQAATLRAGPGAAAESIRELEAGTLLDAVGGAGDWYRIELPDRSQGYVLAALVEPADRPIESHEVDVSAPVLETPRYGATPVADLVAGDRLEVLGRFDGFLFARSEGGVEGWLLAVADE